MQQNFGKFAINMLQDWFLENGQFGVDGSDSTIDPVDPFRRQWTLDR